ncbi:MAG: glycoside hydrolase 5 family protein [Candidatus Dormibacteraceae bacterium]
MCLAAAALLLGSEVWPQAKPTAPLVGFSYSPLISQEANRVPAQDLAILLDATDPDLVRLPVYWESVEPTPDSLDFSSVDELLDVVEAHDQVASRPTRVVLTIGARNFLYPELHEPAWAAPRRQPHLNDLQTAAAYRSYFDGSLMRYRSSPLLYAWQVENEPLDYVGNVSTGDDQIKVAELSWEIAEAHLLDPGHEVVTTSFDGWNVTVDIFQLYASPVLALLGGYPSGHPGESLAAGDALGLDVYIDGPSTPLRFTNPDLRSVWKQQAIDFWASQARGQGKQLWLAEMQAQPWSKSQGYTPANLVASAMDYRQEPLQVVLLWGVETWLRDPAWMAAANHAMAILRS